ncbi:hypothetical protein [Natronorubrum sp. A-ect3]|uniref:hypothetical protein n=1 Tax=Natronorubrum sp. A-ect3 TaxID=3242698 RepID=UPI00359EDB8A
MAVRTALTSFDAGLRGSDTPDTAFQLATAIYGGTLLAGFVTTAIALVGSSLIVLAATSAIGFISGCLGGLMLARVDHELPARLGRTVTRQLALTVPAVPLGVVGGSTWVLSLEPYVDVVAFPSAVVVFATGYALSKLAGDRYVETVVGDDPIDTWRWLPPGSVKLDGVLVFLYVVLAGGNAIVENWLQALLWVSLGSLWVGSCLVEGRWRFGPSGDRTELQLYDAGIVKQRPYTRTLVHWRDIDHVRMHNGGLVFDCGLRSVRFNRDELEEPDAVLEAVDQQLAAQNAW